MRVCSQGQGQVVTCSGAYKDGSLRVIRNGKVIILRGVAFQRDVKLLLWWCAGIGINEQATIEMPVRFLFLSWWLLLLRPSQRVKRQSRVFSPGILAAEALHPCTSL